MVPWRHSPGSGPTQPGDGVARFAPASSVPTETPERPAAAVILAGWVIRHRRRRRRRHPVRRRTRVRPHRAQRRHRRQPPPRLCPLPRPGRRRRHDGRRPRNHHARRDHTQPLCPPAQRPRRSNEHGPPVVPPTSTNAAAMAESPAPGRHWNASCPGTPAPTTSAPGAAIGTARRVNPRTDNARTGIGDPERPYRLPGLLLTRLSNTYPSPSSLAMSIRWTSEVPGPGDEPRRAGRDDDRGDLLAAAVVMAGDGEDGHQ